jgi:outer membrane protein OmpA-like peptidoglycan-associated protein
MWINEVKVFDLPKSYPVSSKLNRFAITISPSVYTEEDLGLYFSSFKMAAGMPEANTKILTEGKWSTTAITFDVASDRVRESSMGAIKELGELLAGNQDLRLQIIGHTDNDGNKQANLELSEKRAISVKRLLKTYYGVDDERITTIGKGSTEPVGDNKTTIGKAQNRRVEFIKL